MRPLSPSTCAAYCDQPPGAAPRSTTTEAGAQDAVFLLNLVQLVDRTRAVAFALRALDKFVIEMFSQPLVAAFASAHCLLSTAGCVALIITPLFTEKWIMSLTEKMKRDLRGRGHTLKPVVSIGNAGLSTAVLREIDLSLEHHELMKIRIGAADREQRKADHYRDLRQLRCRTGTGHRAHCTHLP